MGIPGVPRSMPQGQRTKDDAGMPAATVSGVRHAKVPPFSGISFGALVCTLWAAKRRSYRISLSNAIAASSTAASTAVSAFKSLHD